MVAQCFTSLSARFLNGVDCFRPGENEVIDLQADCPSNRPGEQPIVPPNPRPVDLNAWTPRSANRYVSTSF